MLRPAESELRSDRQYILRPDSLNLPCIYSTFHFEYLLVLSRFCFDMIYILPYIFVYYLFIVSPLWLDVSTQSVSISRVIYKELNVCHFDYPAFAVLEGWDHVNRFNHTSCIAVVTQTDHPKSVRKCCVIEDVVGFLMLSFVLTFEFSVGRRSFVIGLSQISFLYSKLAVFRFVALRMGGFFE